MAEGMHLRLWGALMLSCLLGCAGPQRQLRLAVGPGPGCASTLDCACKRGSAAACEQLATVSKPPKTPNVPGPVLPPDALNPGESDEDPRERCSAHYVKCVEQGGGHLPGRTKNYSRCVDCMDYCIAHGFWPEALYTWNKVRLPCPGL